MNKRMFLKFLAAILGGVIFAAVGAGYQRWEASQNSLRPTMAPISATPEGGKVVERREASQNSPGPTSGKMRATPDGGRVIERGPQRARSGGRFETTFVATRFMFTALGGCLYGALFSAIFGTRQPVKLKKVPDTVSEIELDQVTGDDT